MRSQVISPSGDRLRLPLGVGSCPVHIHQPHQNLISGPEILALILQTVIPLVAMEEVVAKAIDDDHQRCRDLGGPNWFVAKDPLDHRPSLSVQSKCLEARKDRATRGVAIAKIIKRSFELREI